LKKNGGKEAFQDEAMSVVPERSLQSPVCNYANGYAELRRSFDGNFYIIFFPLK
jgi:hypothetical protein